MATTAQEIAFLNPTFRQISAANQASANPSSAAFSTVINYGDTAVNIVNYSTSLPNVSIMPMFFGLSSSNVWMMMPIPMGGAVNVDPGVPTVFAPGYLHMMIMTNAGAPIPLPDSFEITFTFAPANGGDTFPSTVTFYVS